MIVARSSARTLYLTKHSRKLAIVTYTGWEDPTANKIYLTPHLKIKLRTLAEVQVDLCPKWRQFVSELFFVHLCQNLNWSC